MKSSVIVRIVVFIFTIILFATTACKTDTSDTVVLEIEAELAETGNIIPRTIEISEDQVIISIEIPSGETEFTLYSTWVYLFNLALENVPAASQVVLELYTLGEPYATLTAKSDDIEAVINEEIDLLNFFSRLEMTDQRPPEDGLRQALASRNWIVTDVTISSNRTDIEAFPPVVQTHEEIVMYY